MLHLHEEGGNPVLMKQEDDDDFRLAGKLALDESGNPERLCVGRRVGVSRCWMHP
jgi:hypothetical protein